MSRLKAQQKHLLEIVSGQACRCNDSCNGQQRHKVVHPGHVVPEPWQQETAAVPPNQQVRRDVLLIWHSHEATNIASADRHSRETCGECLRYRDLKKTPRASIVSSPESCVPVHAGKATASNDKVSSPLPHWQIVESFERRFMQIVGIERRDVYGGTYTPIFLSAFLVICNK